MLCINISGIKWRIEVIIWISKAQNGEGHGNPLQYSCLENPMDRGALVGCSPWGHKEMDMTERLHFHFSLSCIGEGNGKWQWQPTPVFLPGKSHGQRSLVGCSPWGR